MNIKSPHFYPQIEVRGDAERDISSLGAMGWGVEVAGKFFRRRRPPQKWVFGDYHFPSFSDT